VTDDKHEQTEGFGGRALKLAFPALLLLGLDQATKALVSSRLSHGESVEVVPGFLHFTLVRNTGMAFGMLSGFDLPLKSLLMTLFSIAALAAVLYYALRSPGGDRMTRYGLALILGGALGNIADRVRLGYVVDFVDVFYKDAHWPAFNVADSSICVGVGLLLLDGLLRHEGAAEPEVAGER
jgi:signal peptidase II